MIEPGETVLLLNSGYFGDSFADWYVQAYFSICQNGTDVVCYSLRAYGAEVDEIRADFGKSATQAELEQALKAGKKYKAVAFTHVDTSTAVLADAKAIGETVKRLSPESLVNPFVLETLGIVLTKCNRYFWTVFAQLRVKRFVSMTGTLTWSLVPARRVSVLLLV